MKNSWKIILVIALLLGGIVSAFASEYPDGLEKVAESQDFLERGYTILPGIMPDYIFPGITNEMAATGFAGIIGTVLTFLIIWKLINLLSTKKRQQL